MSLRCDICDVSFKSEDDLLEHNRLHQTVERSIEEHGCACGTAFETEAELYAHATETHRP